MHSSAVLSSPRPVIRRRAFGQVAGEVFREAMVGLVRNRVRAGLSMLGISWGIVSVVMLLAYGEGFNQALLTGFKGAFGDGVTVMFPGQTSLQAGGERAGKRVRLRITDAQAVGELPLIKAWSPEIWTELPVSWGVKQGAYLVRAVAPDYAVMRSQRASAGRFFDDEDVRLQRRVAFVGSEMARKVFGNVPPVGQTIRIKGMAFEVIGVQKEKVQLSNYGRPDRYCIFIPYTTAGQLWNTEYLTTLVYQAMDPTLDGRATAQVKDALGKRVRFDPKDERALRSFGSAEAQQITSSIVIGLKLVLGFIGVLTLAIGGVGVMNIMFVSVTERTKEIGLRKALGARRSDIMSQVLTESVTLSTVGGLAGIALGFVAARALSAVTPLPARLEPWSIVLGIGITAAVGLFFGAYPAARAARLDPIEALRRE
jgi:putative ABC transport system permease protein